MIKILRGQNSTAFSRKAAPDKPLNVLAGNCHRTLIDESGMIRAQKGTHITSQMIAL
jgi:hypothetical protein